MNVVMKKKRKTDIELTFNIYLLLTHKCIFSTAGCVCPVHPMYHFGTEERLDMESELSHSKQYKKKKEKCGTRLGKKKKRTIVSIVKLNTFRVLWLFPLGLITKRKEKKKRKS